MAERKAPLLTAGGLVPDVDEATLAKRWYPEEEAGLSRMKSALREELALRPKNAISSERRMLRFLLQFGLNAEKAIVAYRKHLRWRRENRVDEMHDRLLREQLDAFTVPHAKKIINLLPQIPCDFNLFDRSGNPLSVEWYGFDPYNVFKFTTEEYLEFFLFSLEYKMLVVDHFSSKAELELIASSEATGAELEVGWGSRSVRRICAIRDLRGFQVAPSIAPRVISLVMELMSMFQSNYPQMMDHSFFLNTPWTFSAVWSVLKNGLTSRARSKVHILPSDYHAELLKYIALENMPEEFRPIDSETSPTSIEESTMALGTLTIQILCFQLYQPSATLDPLKLVLRSQITGEEDSLFIPICKSHEALVLSVSKRDFSRGILRFDLFCEPYLNRVTIEASLDGSRSVEKQPLDIFFSGGDHVEATCSALFGYEPLGAKESAVHVGDISIRQTPHVTEESAARVNTNERPSVGLLTDDSSRGWYSTFSVGASLERYLNFETLLPISRAETTKVQESVGDAARQVDLIDITIPWAVWCYDFFEVRKYAFEAEVEARRAFSSWSCVRILTKDNIEVDVHGSVFALSATRIREKIAEERRLLEEGAQ